MAESLVTCHEPASWRGVVSARPQKRNIPKFLLILIYFGNFLRFGLAQTRATWR